MGDGGLRCLICQGKFGGIVTESRCGLCLYLYRFQNLVLSEQFPACGGPILEPEVRQLYFKGLEGADSYRRSAQGVNLTPGEETGGSPLGAAQLTAKSKARPPPATEATGEPTVAKREEEAPNYSPDESSQQAVPEEEEPKGKEKKRKPTKSPARERARSSGIRRERRSPRRSRSRSQRRRRSTNRRGESQPGSPRGREKRVRSQQRSGQGEERPPLPRRSLLRPRSPPGPPPPRPEGGRWKGPIPAYSGRGQQGGWDYSRPEPENKGIKKRKQQALFAEFKAWRKRRDRRRS